MTGLLRDTKEMFRDTGFLKKTVMIALPVAMQGMLETSNADLAEEYTKMIESQRAYGMALKMVQASDEIETTINGLR